MEKPNLNSLLAIAVVLPLFNFVPFIAQAQTDSAIPIDDQAKYLQNLEIRSAQQWDFVDANAESEVDYSASASDVRFRDDRETQWDNTGDRRKSSFLIDVYDFSEDDTSQ